LVWAITQNDKQESLDNMSKIGVTIGKFYPLHKGHELMIEMAASQLDELIVIVSSSEDVLDYKNPRHLADLDVRHDIIKQKYAGRNITVLKHRDIIGSPINVDEHGTATDRAFWDYWLDIFSILAPDATHFVSSDRYGAKAADLMGIEWFAVDPDRELIDISATRIRANPLKEWKYISREFRPIYVKKVVVIGAESSGKSTLVKDLGKAWNSPAVPEYGRIMTEIVGGGEWVVEDFHNIVLRQQAMNTHAAKESETGIIFIDTEAYTTYLYCVEYLNTKSEILIRMHQREEFDLVVLVPNNIPWVDDGTRIQRDPKKRNSFFSAMQIKVVPTAKRLVTLKSSGRKERVEELTSAIMKHVIEEVPIHYDIFNLTTQSDSRNVIV
jgi:HTH-type transcriptional repressor of NAD biosynthesis genes